MSIEKPQGLKFKALECVDDTEWILTLETEAGIARQFIFTVKHPERENPPFDCGDFSDLYRQVPGPPFPLWPELLIKMGLTGRKETFPPGSEYESQVQEARRIVLERWHNKD